MPEPTSAVTFDELCAEVGQFRGFGRGAVYGDPTWNARQLGQIETAVKAGVANFYYPEPLPGESVSHTWSFLLPTALLTLASGASTVPLPADFGGFEGPVVNATSGCGGQALDPRHPAFLDQQYAAAPTNTGRPQWVAERPVKGANAKRGQRSELYVFPLADQAYTLRCRYYLQPDALDGDHPYSYGEAAHGQTLIESCLAAAEARYVPGQLLHQQFFARGLAASVSLDRRHKPQRLGVMNEGPGDADPRHLPGSAVTVYGVQY